MSKLSRFMSNGGLETIIVSEDTIVEPNVRVGIDTSSADVSVTLPANPKKGDRIEFFDAGISWGKNPATVVLNGDAVLQYSGANDRFSLRDTGGVLSLVFLGDSWFGWGAEARFPPKGTNLNVIGIAMAEPGKNGGVWQHVNQDGRPIFVPGGAFFDNHPIWGGVEDVLIDGQAMVKIPKFYTKTGYTILTEGGEPAPCWWLSDQPADGFELYPAFYNNGAEVEQIYIGKYQASMDGSKLASRSGVLPAVNRSLTQFIADAKARNTNGVTGFMLWSLYQRSAIQWLYLLENATMDSQAKTGQGRVSASSAAAVDASDVSQATYRGIVGLWGNAWQYMDGLKTAGGSIHVWDRRGYQRWVDTGKKRSADAGPIYPVTFMRHKGVVHDDGYDFTDHFIGDTGPASNAGATAPDYQYFNEASASFPYVGGDWISATSAGLWAVGVIGSASQSGGNRGARLAKV